MKNPTFNLLDCDGNSITLLDLLAGFCAAGILANHMTPNDSYSVGCDSYSMAKEILKKREENITNIENE